MEGTKIVIEIDNTSEISNFIQLLNKHNLNNDIDFTFMYEPLTRDKNFNIKTPKQVTFYFKESKNATWFSLIV